MNTPSSIYRATGTKEPFKDWIKKYNANGGVVDEIIVIEEPTDDSNEQSDNDAFSDYAPNGFDDGSDPISDEDAEGFFVYQPTNDANNGLMIHKCIMYGCAGLIAGIVTGLIINDLKK